MQECAGIDLGDDAGNWISEYLHLSHATSKLSFRLLYHPYSPGIYEDNFYGKKEPDELTPHTRKVLYNIDLSKSPIHALVAFTGVTNSQGILFAANRMSVSSLQYFDSNRK